MALTYAAAEPPAALLITGTVGVKKSTIAGHVGDLLSARRTAYAVLDGLLRQRLTARHALDPADRAWHLSRTVELDTALDAARVSDHDIDIGARQPQVIARDVTAAIGW